MIEASGIGSVALAALHHRAAAIDPPEAAELRRNLPNDSGTLVASGLYVAQKLPSLPFALGLTTWTARAKRELDAVQRAGLPVQVLLDGPWRWGLAAVLLRHRMLLS